MLLATIALLACAAPALAADTWMYAESDHFEVYTTGGDRRAREALTYFERVHAFFVEFLGLSVPPGRRTRLVVFNGDRQFEPYRPGETAVAFYLGGADRDHIVMRSLDDTAYPIVVHEYAHLVERYSPGVYPVWLNEGLAEFFSTLELEGDRMGVGKVPEGRLAYIRQGVGMMKLDDLFAVSHSSPEYRTRSHAGIFYAQSWALTHMLLTNDRYRPQAGAFLKLIEQGVPSREALTKAFGKTSEQVGSDLINYVRQDQFLYFPVPYKAPPDVRNVPTRRVEVHEADLVTAQLLSNMPDRQAEARAVYERLTAARPDDLQVLEARAWFEIRHGEATDAVPYLRRAAEGGSRAAFVYRHLAMLEPDRARDLLARLVQLAPDDVDGRLQYARVLMNEERVALAAATLLTAVAVPQDRRFTLYQMLANAYMRMNRIEDGRQAAELALRYAEPGSEEEYARKLIAAIDDFARARANAEEQARRVAAARAAGDATPEPGTPAIPVDAQLEPPPLTLGGSTDREAMIVVRGRVKNMVCTAGQPPVLEVATDTALVRLVLDAPELVTVVGPETGVVEMQCGAQDAAIRIGYLPTIGAGETVGRVRLLDFR